MGQPVLSQLYPGCQKSKANGIKESYISEHLHLGLSDMLPERGISVFVNCNRQRKIVIHS